MKPTQSSAFCYSPTGVTFPWLQTGEIVLSVF